MFKLSHGFYNTCGEKNQLWFGIFGSPLSPDSGPLAVLSLLGTGEEKTENAGQLLAFPLPQLCQAVNTMVLVLLAWGRPGGWDLGLFHARTPLLLVPWGTPLPCSVAGCPRV